jgi:hypothetical protein
MVDVAEGSSVTDLDCRLLRTKLRDLAEETERRLDRRGLSSELAAVMQQSAETMREAARVLEGVGHG